MPILRHAARSAPSKHFQGHSSLRVHGNTLGPEEPLLKRGAPEITPDRNAAIAADDALPRDTAGAGGTQL
jgi:hypothetical protein